MTISPSGKTRRMVAQTFANPLMDNTEKPYESNELNMPNAQSLSNEPDIPETPDIPEVPEDIDIQEKEMITEPENEQNTLSDFIFKKLESFGYPGRRLEEYKKKFVVENVSPDGIKDIKVEIPDKYYPDERGQTKTIETEDLSDIVREIEKRFGLNFNGAKRSEGKWLINLTSAKKEEKQENEMVRDNLDEVYGPAKGNNKKIAQTQKEIISMQKDVLISNLQKIIGDKNV